MLTLLAIEGATGFKFQFPPGDKNNNNIIGNWAEIIGSLSHEDRMAVYFNQTNTAKGGIWAFDFPKFKLPKKATPAQR
jgi:hypothetical protein